MLPSVLSSYFFNYKGQHHNHFRHILRVWCFLGYYFKFIISFRFFPLSFSKCRKCFFPTLSPIIIPVDNNIIVLFSVCAILWICERRTYTHSSPLMSSPPSPTLNVLALRLTMQGYPEPKLVPCSVQQLREDSFFYYSYGQWMLRCIKRFTLGHAENWVKVYNVVPFGIFCPFNRQRKDGRTEGSMNRQTYKCTFVYSEQVQ